VQLAFPDLEDFGDLPSEWSGGPGSDVAAIRGLEVAGISGLVIEENETENDSALLVDDRVSPIANETDKV
jgi:hypothetical protein